MSRVAMLEAMKIDVDSFNLLSMFRPDLFSLGLPATNGQFLVREIGTGTKDIKIFDMHEFHARFRFLAKKYDGGFAAVDVLPVDEQDDTPVNPPLPGNLDPGYPRG